MHLKIASCSQYIGFSKPFSKNGVMKEGKNMDSIEFFSKFCFKPELRGAIGVEREYFLTDASGKPVPRSPEFLKRLNDPAWTYELSACQVEHRTSPSHSLRDIRSQLVSGQERGMKIALDMHTTLSSIEVADEDMPLDVYPDDERYRAIVKMLPQATLRAACRVTGVHLHYGCTDIHDALRVHNILAPRLNEFVALGDHSNGERIRLYREMAKNWQPPIYRSLRHFQHVAREQGFESNPRDCWHLIRISRHGSVELRMFGMTASCDEIVSWVRFVKHVIESA